MDLVTILTGDCREMLRTLPAESVQCCVTSPPYFGLRDYGCDGQIGLEENPEAFVAQLVDVFREVRRVLRTDGALWLNLGDSYANDGKWGGTTGGKHAEGLHGEPVGRLKRNTGLKPKDLIGIPWRVAFALQADGWYLRSDVIWAKPNPMPESVTDRPTKAHEYVFLLSKSDRYFYDADAIAEQSIRAGDVPRGGRAARNQADPRVAFFRPENGIKPVAETRNKRTVWEIPTQPFPEAHFATYPEELARLCILAGSREGDLVLDPFGGSGTTAAVAVRHGRRAVICELNPEYVAIARRRIGRESSLFTGHLFAEVSA